MRRSRAAGRGRAGLVVAGAGCLAGMVAAQVASGVGSDPVRLTGPVVGLLAAEAGCFAASRRGLERACGAVSAAVAVGYAAEWVGVRTGVPFGRYAYTAALRPQVGGVPVAVAGAWAGMGLASHAVAAAIVPAGRRAARAAVGAASLTAWDLFLDPQMWRQDLWRRAVSGCARQRLRRAAGGIGAADGIDGADRGVEAGRVGVACGLRGDGGDGDARVRGGVRSAGPARRGDRWGGDGRVRRSGGGADAQAAPGQEFVACEKATAEIPMAEVIGVGVGGMVAALLLARNVRRDAPAKGSEFARPIDSGNSSQTDRSSHRSTARPTVPDRPPDQLS